MRDSAGGQRVVPDPQVKVFELTDSPVARSRYVTTVQFTSQ